ncbi:MAG: hypothetical protein ACFFDB_00065 [Promethearchaeota archaeon]
MKIIYVKDLKDIRERIIKLFLNIMEHPTRRTIKFQKFSIENNKNKFKCRIKYIAKRTLIYDIDYFFDTRSEEYTIDGGYSGYILNIIKNVLHHYDTHFSYREIDGRYKLKSIGDKNGSICQ